MTVRVSAPTVSLPMYNLPEMRQVNAAFWTALRIVLAGTVRGTYSSTAKSVKYATNAGHSPDEVADLMPGDYALGNKAMYVQSIKNSLPMYSRDGRFAPEAAETAYAGLKAFDPVVGSARIDLSATYTNAFVENAKP